MATDTPIPLVDAATFEQGAFNDLVRGYDQQALNNVMIQATRACETETGRRLAPFTVTESHRCEGVDPDEYTDAANLPLDLQGALGRSYAYSLGASTLIRHLWLNEYAALFPDMWAYSNVSIQIIRSYGGGETLGVNSGQFIGPELDTGHVLFNLGKFIPIGSWARVTYSGGYQTVPADLTRACMWMAAAIVCRELDPLGSRSGHSPGDLEALAVGWLAAYVRS